MKIVLIRALTLAGLLALSAPAHAMPGSIWFWLF
jgi:hypothetical protein